MALIVNASNPNALLVNIKKAIDEKEIDTWRYDDVGDFTHVTHDGQWEGKAWMRPSVVSGVLIFGIVARNDENLTNVVYGVYHGRFAEMLLTHFDGEFSSVQATALLTNAMDVYK